MVQAASHGDYWQHVSSNFQSGGAAYLSKASSPVVQGAIKDILSHAQNQLNQLNQLNKNDYLKPEVAHLLNALKMVKNYSSKQQSALSLFLNKIGIYTDSSTRQLNGLIAQAESHIQQGSQIRQRLLTPFKPEDKRFLQVATKLSNKIDELARNLKPEEQKDLTLENLLGPEESEFFSNYLKNTDPKNESLFQALHELRSDLKLFKLLGPELGENISPASLSLLEDIMAVQKFAGKHRLASIVSRSDSLLQRIQKGETPKQEEKLSVKEFATFDILPAISPRLSIFNQAGFLTGPITEDLETLKKAKDIRGILKSTIQDELKEPDAMPSGCFSLFNIFKDYAIHNKKNLGFMGLVQVVSSNSKYNHAGIIYKEKENIKQSHVLGSYVNENVGFYDLAVSEYVALDWKKLISKKNQEGLQKAFGDQWEKKVQAYYDKACAKFHQNGEFTNLNNDVAYRYRSVIKPYIQLQKNNPDAFVFKDRKMFCSQFTGMATEVTLKMLNEELAKDDALKGMTSGSIVKSPFSENENFSAMHPGRLVKVLKAYTKPVPPLNIVEKMVNFDTGIKHPAYTH